MRTFARLTVTALAVIGLAASGAPAAQADTTVSPRQLARTSGLTAEQKQAIDTYVGQAPTVRAAKGGGGGVQPMASGSSRASYYRGSVLMWTRDNVDFGWSNSSVTWSSGYQQAGAIFPNIARNKGIARYYTTSTNHKWRAANTIGAGVVTPWGDVTVYTSDFIHRLSVFGYGSWSAWSD